MKIICDQYDTGDTGDTGESTDSMYQVRSDDCGITTSLVGRIGEMICDVTVPQANASLVGAGLKALENWEITLKPKE